MLTDTPFFCAPNVFDVTLHIRFSDVCFASSCGGASADADVVVDVNADDKADADADVVDGQSYIENKFEGNKESMVNDRNDEGYTRQKRQRKRK